MKTPENKLTLLPVYRYLFYYEKKEYKPKKQVEDQLEVHLAVGKLIDWKFVGTREPTISSPYVKVEIGGPDRQIKIRYRNKPTTILDELPPGARAELVWGGDTCNVESKAINSHRYTVLREYSSLPFDKPGKYSLRIKILADNIKSKTLHISYEVQEPFKKIRIIKDP